jgi:hypothetical protein
MIKYKDCLVRSICYDLCTHAWFDFGILIAILFNTLSLMIRYPTITDQTKNILENVNYFFTTVFILEALIKLLAFGRPYFRDNWNKFDFFIVIQSIVFIAISNIWGIHLGTTA